MRIIRFVLMLLIACSTFVVGISAHYFYAEAAAFLFKPKQSTPETTQSLTPRAAAPPLFQPAPYTPIPQATPDYSKPSCENCVEDDLCGLCQPLSGEYTNYVYRYTLTIPDELNALQPASPAADYGFMGRLVEDPEAVIEVEGVYNNGLSSSVNEVANEHLKFTEASARDISVLKRTKARLGKRAAVRYVVQYTSLSTGLLMIEDKTIALIKEAGYPKETWTVYAVTLQTPAVRYHKNLVMLEKVLKRWRELEAHGC